VLDLSKCLDRGKVDRVVVKGKPEIGGTCDLLGGGRVQQEDVLEKEHGTRIGSLDELVDVGNLDDARELLVGSQNETHLGLVQECLSPRILGLARENVCLYQILEVEDAGVLDATETPYEHGDRVTLLDKHIYEVSQLTRVATLGTVEWCSITR